MIDMVYTVDDIGRILNPVFTSHKVRKAVLFGSYVKGEATENSDVDSLVDSGLSGFAFFGLLEDIVTSLGKDVDLIDTSQIISNSKIDHEIEKNGVVIYGQQRPSK